jgi:hypothetical protein
VLAAERAAAVGHRTACAGLVLVAIVAPEGDADAGTGAVAKSNKAAAAALEEAQRVKTAAELVRITALFIITSAVARGCRPDVHNYRVRETRCAETGG